MNEARREGLTGRHVLIIALAGIGTVVVVNVFFAWAAIKTHTGLDVGDAYTLGVAYNDQLEERARQAALGWQEETRLEHRSDGAHIVVVLSDQAGAPLTGLIVEGSIRRRVEAQSDQLVVLTEVAPGRYEEALDLPYVGRWQVRLSATDSADGRLDFEETLWAD